MADNVTLDAGSGGSDIRTDDDGTAHWQYVKIAFGADNTQTIVGSISSNPFPVALSATDNAVLDVLATSIQTIDSVVGGTDSGVAILAKHAAATARLSSAEDDYDIPRLSEFGALLTEPEQHLVIDDMNNLVGFGGTWAAIDTDTTGVAVSTKHVLGSQSIEFDKVDGAANSGIGGVTKALTSINLDGASPHDILQCVTFVSATTALDGGSAFFFLRLGTDSTDYNEWRIDGTEFTAGVWETVALEIGDASHTGQGGAGIDWAAITYIAVGFSFDAVGDALANILVDEISYHTNQHVNAAINAEITSDVSSANVNLQKVAGSPATKSSGNVGNGTQRVTIADDDTNLAAIKTAVELLDDAISGAQMQVDVVAALPAGTNAIGKLAANSGVDIGDVDVTSLPNAIGTGGSKLFTNGDLNLDVEITDTATSTVYWIYCLNLTASVQYLSIWDADSADIALGTDAATYQFIIPTQGDTNGAGILIPMGPHGVAFTTGLSIGAATSTGGSGDPNGISVAVGYQD